MLEIDREICIGSGMCALTAPEVFDQSDDDGRVLAQPERIEPHNLDAVHRAVTLCPSGALSLAETPRRP